MTDDERKKALAAAGILQNDVFLEVLRRLDERYVAAWRAAKTPEAREEQWHRQMTLGEIEAELFREIQSAAVDCRGKDEEITSAFRDVQTKRRRKNG